MNTAHRSGLARTDAVTAAALLVAAAVVAIVGASATWLSLPVTATFTRAPEPPARGEAVLSLAEAPVTIAHVHLPTAVAVILVFMALVRLLCFVPGIRDRRIAGIEADRHLVRWIEFSQVAGVVVFLVAQLNGITEVTSLVPLYALSASAALLLIVHDRRTLSGRAGLLAFSFGTVVAIIPWGVIAFAQIGGSIAGVGAAALIRIITVAALLATAAVWFVTWANGRTSRAGVGVRTEIGLALATLAAPVILGLIVFAGA